MKRHQRLFEPTEPPPPRRKLMHVVDAGEAGGVCIVRCECHRCKHDSGWIKAPPLTEAKRGIPCPVCSQKGAPDAG